MSDEPKAARRFAAEEGRRFMTRAFLAAGMPEDDAAGAAEAMLFADLRGVDSHGIVRLPTYIRRLRGGGINPVWKLRLADITPKSIGSPVPFLGTNGNDLLGMAGATGDQRLSTLLLERGADPERANIHGWTALHQAAYSDQAELARELLDHGVPGLHFYTMNQVSATVEICEALGLSGNG